jgi:NACalpha-BTF3-like transcription factor
MEVQDMEEKMEAEDKPAQQNNTAFSAEVVAQVMSLGYSREAAIEALTVCDGDPNAAVAYLLG